jgi:mono/diheme cytochrome c family protein
MKNILNFGLAFFIILIQSCGPKEKQEESSKNIDSVVVETTIIDTTSISTENLEEENITEEVKSVQKEALKPNTKTPVVTKKVEEEVIKSITEKNPEIKTEEVVKKEVIVEKVTEVKKEVETVLENPKTVVSTSNWAVPENYKKMKNPLESDNDNLKEAKTVYDIQCKSCHGSKGLGDGSKAKSMKGDLGDFSSAKFHVQSDGELFYKTKVGRADMPGFSKKLSDEDIWLTVLYIRTLKK